MALFTARKDDLQVCPTHGPATMPEGALSVKVNSRATVRVGDPYSCGGSPDRVTTGASTVTFGGEFAARLTDQSEHGGRIILGAFNVVIGGPAGMGTIGAGKSVCQAMAAGRKSGRTKQSYGNCVLESCRQIVRRATGNEVMEDEFLKHADEHGHTTAGAKGGSNGDHGAALLGEFGVPAERMPADGPPTLATIKQAISERRGVVAFIDPHTMSPESYKEEGNHAIAVIGVELDAQGNVTAVFVNDTGAGECGKKVPADVFAAAMRNLPSERSKGGARLLVTKGPIW
ncbi:MAG: PAAR domain-containing protein [Polyangiaceae bacterium]